MRRTKKLLAWQRWLFGPGIIRPPEVLMSRYIVVGCYLPSLWTSCRKFRSEFL
jgi:hypothetical protein